jgi:peptidoglycan/LPS O-acetylase OafA/YrhL
MIPTLIEILAGAFLLLAFLSSGYFLSSRYPVNEVEKESHDIQLDGLRGVLAFGVMLFHFLCISQVVKIDKWDLSHYSPFVNLLGFHTVFIFFGITGYLFLNKVLYSLDTSDYRFWLKLYIGRLFRLVPVALVCSISLCILFLDEVSAYYSLNGKMPISFVWAMFNVATSSLFSKAHDPAEIGKDQWAYTIAAGPNWSLHYEWLFYLLLPVIAVAGRKKTNLSFVLVTIALLSTIDGTKNFFVSWTSYTWAFIPGILVSIMRPKILNWSVLKHPFTGAFTVMLLLMSPLYARPKFLIPILTVFLAILISNNDFTKVCSAKVLRSVGQTTYSIYLLHGIVQYATIKWIVTIPLARSMPDWLWWIACGCQVIVILVIGRMSYEYIEKPGMEAGKRFYKWLENLIDQRCKRYGK